MSWSSPQSILGAMVLASGIVAVGATSHARTSQADVEVAPTTTVAATQPAVIEFASPAVPGVDESIQRVLYAYGKAHAYAPSEVTELPTSVARVLAYYGVTLMIPVDEQGSATFEFQAGN